MSTSKVTSNPLWIPFTVPGTPPTLLVESGSGSSVRTTDGRSILDFAGGLWNVGFGYSDDQLATAVHTQLDKLAYYPTFREMASETAVLLAERLVQLVGSPDAKVVLGTGGGSAVEIAIKLASVVRPGGAVVSLVGSYHGTMYGGSAVSGQDLMQRGTRASFDWMHQVPPNDCAAFLNLASRVSLAGVLLEPVIGNGCVPLTDEFVECVIGECRRQGALVIADEVATGFGRTGPLLASDAWSQVPDIRLVSKLLTAGAGPLAALLIEPRVWQEFRAQGIGLPHGETQGANPLACAAALSVIQRWASPGFAAAIADRAATFDRWMADRPWGIGAIEGRGFMQSVTLSRTSAMTYATVEQRTQVVATMLLGAGLRVYAGGDHLCFFPPLTVSDAELEQAAKIVDETWKLLP